MKASSEIHIERHGIEFAVTVSGFHVKESRGHRDKYGAPEEPDEPAYLDDLEAHSVNDVKDESSNVLIAKGEEVELTESEQTKAEEAIWEAMSAGGFSPEPPDPEFYADDYRFK